MTPYTANKQYDVNYNYFTLEGIKIYTGQKVTGSFNSSTDPITTDNRYRRLVYDSVNHKFYQNFSGSYIDVRESLRSENYESSSVYRPSGSYYDYKDVRATGSLPDAIGSTIKVIELPTNITGEGLSEGSVVLTSMFYTIEDDSFGNLIDTRNGDIFVGNVIYNQGVLVVTNQAYQSYFDFTEPTTTTTTSTTTTTTTAAPTTTTTSTTSTTTTAAPTTSTTTTTTTPAPTTTTSTTTTTTTAAPTTTTTTTTTSTTTTTTTAAGGLTIANNAEAFGPTIDSVTPEGIVTSGSFPINKGEFMEQLLGTGIVSFTVNVTFATGSVISLYKNSVLIDSKTVTFTGTVTLDSITYVSTDDILIELT